MGIGSNKTFRNYSTKKLFDAQCLWRAEQLKMPEVSICNEFWVWQKNVLNCKFIEPITPADVELYQQYLLTDEPDEHIGWWNHTQWQYYERILESVNDSENSDYEFPAWYQFHNTFRGTAGYMSLPNIRGEKEDLYLSLGKGDVIKEIEIAKENIETPVETNHYTYLSFHDKKILNWIVDNFETKEIRSLYKAY